LLPSDAHDEVRRWAGNPELELFGYSAGAHSWIHVPDHATFRFGRGTSRVDAFAAAGADPSALRDLYERSVLPLVLQAEGHQVLHASAVRDGGNVIAFVGASRSGKSTLAYALAQRGFPLWADDAVAFDGSRATVVSTPLPFTPRLRPSAKLALTHSPQTVERPTGRGDASLACIVLLRPDEDGDPKLERLRRAEAFPAVLPHAYCFSLADRTRNRELIGEYLRLVERVPVWRVRFPRRPEHLPQTVDELERLIRAATTA
jgi:hypothetical protein